MKITGKRYRAGTHRVIFPAETLLLIKPLFGAMGITRVANITGQDHIGIPVLVTSGPNARSLSVSQGKGVTKEAGRVSRAMKSIVFFHAENIVAPLLFASRNQLRFTHRLANVEALPRTSVSRYSDDLKISWIPNRSIALSRAITEAVQCRLTFIASSRDDIGWRDFRQAGDSNITDRFRQSLLAGEATPKPLRKIKRSAEIWAY